MSDATSALSYPVGENEDARLDEILRYDFADAGPRNSLGDICQLAQTMFGVPVAVITLVERDRQTFLAKCGLDIEGTPREGAFCNHTILDDGVLVVEDATLDARFADNPAVTGPHHLRFYAGAPISLRPGIRIGALCLIDVEPRVFSEAEMRQLELLARMAVNELHRRRSMIELARQQELLSQTARMTQVGSWKYDLETQAITWSEETYRIFGLDPSVTPTRDLVRAQWAPDGVQLADEAMIALMRDGRPLDHEVEIINARGERRWVRCLAEVERASDGRIVRALGSMQDISEQREHAAEIERLAYIDSLTGLPNRALFHRRLGQALAEARASGGNTGLVMLDLDHFKDVNDTLGHDAGDALLRSVSERLRRAFRATDTIARLGGDEFAVVLSGARGLVDLMRPTRVLLDLLRHPVEHGGKTLSISASVGAVLYTEEGQTPAQLLKDADIALYRAKNAGRNRVVVFEPHMRDEVEQRMALLSDARRGLEAGEFELFYQPLVSIQPPRVVTGFEGLMRWRHPERGILSPESFAAAFEDQEVSLALGEVALDGAMVQMRAWMERGVEFGRVAVNLSASQFRTGILTETVAAKLKRWGVPADHLTLEVTENVYMGWSSDVVADTIRALHEMGVLIALDDFGTGYASLANLRQFPIDRLKIDKAFVQNTDDAAIVKAVLTLGASMGMTVVAEGVEDLAQLEELGALGCDQAQGYYFARPMPGREVPGFLESFCGQAETLGKAVA